MRTIQIANNSIFYERIKHIEVDSHSIIEVCGLYEISFPRI